VRVLKLVPFSVTKAEDKSLSHPSSFPCSYPVAAASLLPELLSLICASLFLFLLLTFEIINRGHINTQWAQFLFVCVTGLYCESTHHGNKKNMLHRRRLCRWTNLLCDGPEVPWYWNNRGWPQQGQNWPVEFKWQASNLRGSHYFVYKKQITQ